MSGFYEKVGELGVDLSLNVDKKQRDKVSKLVDGVKQKIGGLAGAFTGLGAKLSIAGVIASLTGGIMAMNHKLSETVDYWDKLQTQADSLKITIEDIQKLKLAADLGDIPNFDAFAKNLMNLRKSMSELQRGETTAGAGYLKDVGIKGNENIVDALKFVLKSLKKSDKSVVDDAVRVLFGKVDAENLQFLVGGGLDAFEKQEKAYKEREKQGKSTVLSSKKSAELGAIDEQLKISKTFEKLEKAENLKLDEAMKSYEASKALTMALDKATNTLAPLIAKGAEGVTSLAKTSIEFMNRIPDFIKQIENTFKKIGASKWLNFLGKDN